MSSSNLKSKDQDPQPKKLKYNVPEWVASQFAYTNINMGIKSADGSNAFANILHMHKEQPAEYVPESVLKKFKSGLYQFILHILATISKSKNKEVLSDFRKLSQKLYEADLYATFCLKKFDLEISESKQNEQGDDDEKKRVEEENEKLKREVVEMRRERDLLKQKLTKTSKKNEKPNK